MTTTVEPTPPKKYHVLTCGFRSLYRIKDNIHIWIIYLEYSQIPYRCTDALQYTLLDFRKCPLYCAFTSSVFIDICLNSATEECLQHHRWVYSDLAFDLPAPSV